MKVFEQFHLYYAKDCWEPSESFLGLLKKSTPNCPCCRIPANPFLKKTTQVDKKPPVDPNS